jgi:NADH-ubiquinone oxidoreductase chain 4
VAHIRMVIGGIIMLSYWEVCRSFALIVAHGLCSSGLFCLSNITCDRFSRRSLLVNKGFINLMPRMASKKHVVLYILKFSWWTWNTTSCSFFSTMKYDLWNHTLSKMEKKSKKCSMALLK